MSATPRDLLKPRQQRVSEVYQLLQYQAGQANSQVVAFGCQVLVDAATTKFQVTAGEYVLGQSIVTFNALTAQVVPGGATTAAGQSVFVLIEADAAAALHLTVGVIVSSGTPVLPQPTPTWIALGYLSLGASFTAGTTVLTGANVVSLAYSAGNVNPAGIQGINGSSGGF